MINQIKTMLALQEAMNTKVDPNWRTAGNEWYRAIWLECGEMMDHVGWKWWARQECNEPQVQLEVVDVMHFMLAISLLNDEDPDKIALAFNGAIEYQDVRDAIDTLAFAQLEHQNSHAVYNCLASVMSSVNMDFNELFKQYCAKNVLNVFRQDNGYKDGTYGKTWVTQTIPLEDNEVLAGLLCEYDGTESNFMGQLRDGLQKVYDDQGRYST